jgi:hypothetical protein
MVASMTVREMVDIQNAEIANTQINFFLSYFVNSYNTYAVPTIASADPSIKRRKDFQIAFHHDTTCRKSPSEPLYKLIFDGRSTGQKPRYMLIVPTTFSPVFPAARFAPHSTLPFSSMFSKKE